MPEHISVVPDVVSRPGELYYMYPSGVPQLPREFNSYIQLLLYFRWEVELKAGWNERGTLDPGNCFILAAFRKQRWLLIIYDANRGGVLKAEIFHFKTPDEKTDVTDSLLKTIHMTDEELHDL